MALVELRTRRCADLAVIAAAASSSRAPISITGSRRREGTRHVSVLAHPHPIPGNRRPGSPLFCWDGESVSYVRAKNPAEQWKSPRSSQSDDGDEPRLPIY